LFNFFSPPTEHFLPTYYFLRRINCNLNYS